MTSDSVQTLELPPVQPVADSASALSPEAQAILERCADLVPLLRESGLANEERRGLGPELIEKLRETGALTMAFPRQWGGTALLPSEQARIIQEVARGDGSAAWVVQITSIANLMLAHANMQLQEEVFGTSRGPTHAGKLEPLPGCTARQVDGGWMIKGRWNFSSTLDHADWVHGGVMCETSDGNRYPAAFFMPKQEEWIVNDWNVMGLAATSSASFHIAEEIFVPAHRCHPIMEVIIGAPPAYADDQPFFAADIGLFTQLISLANAYGCFTAIREIWQEATKTRAQAHPDFTMQAENPVTHLKVGAYGAHAALVRTVIDRIAAMSDQQALTASRLTPDIVSENAALMSYLLTETTDKALEIMRDSSTAVIYRTHPIQRAMRDMIVMNMHAAANRDRNYEAFGRQQFGLSPLMMLGNPGRKAPKPA